MMRSYLFLVVSLCLVLSSLPISGERSEEILPLTRGYTDHDIIRIDGDDDFTPENGVSGGDGSPENPYIIGGYHIDGSPLVPNPHGGGYIEVIYNYCIYVGNTTRHFIIRDCYLEGAGWPYEPVDFGGGVNLFNVSGGAVYNVSTSGNRYSIYMRECSNVTVREISSTEDQTGLALLEGCRNNNLHNITISGSNVGVTLQSESTSGNALEDITVWETSGAGFSAMGAKNNLIERLTVHNSSAAVGLELNGMNNIFIDVESTGNYGYGFRIYSEGDTLRGINASANGNSGVLLGRGSSGNTLHDVVALNNTYHGMELDSCRENTIVGARCAFNGRSGIFFKGASHNTLSDIVTERNKNFGMGLTSSSDSNMISSIRSVGNLEGIQISSGHNIVSYSTFAENLKYGADLSGGLICSGNVFHHNNFLSNNFSAQARDDGTWNSWNDTEGEGNYWSDYQERYPNATNDGHVWDTPYETDGGSGSADHYPLAGAVGETPEDSHPPIARAGENMTVAAGSGITLDGSGSYDPDPEGEIVNYTWEIIRPGGVSNLYGPVVEYTFTEPGEYLITLTVTDGGGRRGEHTITVTVTQALFNLTLGPLLYDDGSPVVDASVTVTGPSYTASTITGPSGNFTLEGIFPGDYSLTVTAEGMEYSSWFTVSEDGRVTGNLSVVRRPPGNLTLTLGPVKDRDGRPLSGVSVIVEWGGEHYTAYTGDDGTVSLILPGDASGENLTVRLKKKGYRDVEFNVSVDGGGSVIEDVPLMESIGAADEGVRFRTILPWLVLPFIMVLVIVLAAITLRGKRRGKAEE